MEKKNSKPVSKRVSRKKTTQTNWTRLVTIAIVVVAFVVEIIYAGGCGSENSGSNNTAGKESNQVSDGNVTTTPKNETATSSGSVEQKKQADSQTNSTTSNNGAVKHYNIKPGPPGRLAIIIDDCGYSISSLDVLAKIDGPLTFSVIPYLPSSKAAIAKANASGKQIMLHLPMQSASGASAEKITILTSMSDSEIEQITRNAINAVPGAVGVNNHQGSKATADSRVMRAVMSVVANNGLFFVDSMTNPASVACDVAREYSVATAENEIFLDNSDSVSYIKERINKAVDMARNKTIIAIGHSRPNTAKALSEMIDEIKQSGIKLIFASEAVR
ncbi:MAG: divergent polysaccharide deacetylase family protein [Negativicutes bacterium]